MLESLCLQPIAEINNDSGEAEIIGKWSRGLL
jgi:hypothetical protein